MHGTLRKHLIFLAKLTALIIVKVQKGPADFVKKILDKIYFALDSRYSAGGRQLEVPPQKKYSCEAPCLIFSRKYSAFFMHSIAQYALCTLEVFAVFC